MQPPQQPPSPPFEIHASGKTTQEKRPSSIGFREGSDDTVSEISDGNEWFYETMCSKFDEDAIPSTIQEYRSRATSQRKAKARAKTSRPATAAAAAHQVAEPANVDDLMAENIQLKEINKSVWRELQSLRQRSQKVNDDAERTRRHVRSAAGSIESLQEQLATSLSLVDALEKEKEDHGRQIDDLQTMVSDLTEKLAATISELNATKEQLQRKERKVDMLENPSGCPAGIWIGPADPSVRRSARTYAWSSRSKPFTRISTKRGPATPDRPPTTLTPPIVLPAE